MSENPYQTPSVVEVSAPVLSDAELIREAHLKHEASLKGVGSLFFLGGALGVIGLAAMVGPALAGSGGAMFAGPDFLLFVSLVGIMIPLQFVAWWGLRNLRPWVRIPATLVAVLGLLAVLSGSILSAALSVYILFLLYSKKGRTILSAGYQEIVDQTPGMKYRTPRWMWIVLLLIVIGVVALFGSIIYFSPS
ncbi:hypothetical protein [Haloferula sp.]|uniref:hypothetical protein n=1 Tax=Haloferula sp. TaxID=2497595 RepID=UPI003C72F9AE